MFSFQIIKIKDTIICNQLESNNVKLPQTTYKGWELWVAVSYSISYNILKNHSNLHLFTRHQCVIIIFLKKFLGMPIAYTGLLFVKSLNLNVVDFSFGFQ